MFFNDWKHKKFRNLNRNLKAICLSVEKKGDSSTVVLLDQHQQQHALFMYDSCPSEYELDLHVESTQGWEFLSKDGFTWKKISESYL